VEEIIPVFTHALILKQGRVAAADVLRKVLSSRRLSEAFDARIRLSQLKGRYRLTVAPRPGVVT
jgi:iron complex transport system ATP-binding protein